MKTEIKEQLDRIEQKMINDSEMDELGHRIIYDVNSGQSLNISGCFIDPGKLDSTGYQIKL